MLPRALRYARSSSETRSAASTSTLNAMHRRPRARPWCPNCSRNCQKAAEGSQKRDQKSDRNGSGGGASFCQISVRFCAATLAQMATPIRPLLRVYHHRGVAPSGSQAFDNADRRRGARGSIASRPTIPDNLRGRRRRRRSLATGGRRRHAMGGKNKKDN